MKSHRLALAAGALFALSYFLPAYAGARGYECFLHCWDLFGRFSADEPLRWLYYVAFVPGNLVFAAALAAGLASQPRLLRTRFILTSAALFHVLSWLLLNLIKESSETIEIQPGYYVWLLAYLLLVASQLAENRRSA